jgi:L-threonylcarbamoyladenylate synthase
MTVVIDVERAARLLRDGEVVAYPTETVYGLGADAESSRALERLRSLKGRDADKGVSVLVPGIDAVGPVPEVARRLAERFWPGPLTLVLPVPGFEPVRSPQGVGFRCSPHPTAAALLRAAGRPLVSTSCNRSGEPPCRSLAEVESSFGSALLVAGGEPAGGDAPSTVVAIDENGAVELLREGAIPFSEIQPEIQEST